LATDQLQLRASPSGPAVNDERGAVNAYHRRRRPGPRRQKNKSSVATLRTRQVYTDLQTPTSWRFW
jgi:hypothetical protein